MNDFANGFVQFCIDHQVPMIWGSGTASSVMLETLAVYTIVICAVASTITFVRVSWNKRPR